MNNMGDLSILQYNIMKAEDKVFVSFLRHMKIWELDMIAIQEQWRNSQFDVGIST